jgi:hypothetical protein
MIRYSVYYSAVGILKLVIFAFHLSIKFIYSSIFSCSRSELKFLHSNNAYRKYFGLKFKHFYCNASILFIEKRFNYSLKTTGFTGIQLLGHKLNYIIDSNESLRKNYV